MDHQFKPNSATKCMALASLILLLVGGPVFWIGANAELQGESSSNLPLWIGSVLFATAYALFVLAIFSALLTFALRFKRSPGDGLANGDGHPQ